jgi:hypothetical protein
MRRCTGYVIYLANCPALWKSKLQMEIALSTMEAKYVALSSSCRDLFPSINITKELSSTFDLQLQVNSNMHIKIHKDNVGALALGTLELHCLT